MARHSYDFTNDTWISDAPSTSSECARPAASNPAGRATDTGMTPASGAAADLRLYSGWARHSQVLRSRTDLLASRPQPSHVPHKAAGTWADEILDGLTVIVGMLTLACIGMFLLVIA